MIGAVAVVAIGIWALLPGSRSTPAAADTGTSAATSPATATPTTEQITVPAASATSPTAGSTPTPGSPTAPTGPAQAIAALEQVVTAQTAAGALDANAQHNLDHQIQNMQQIVAQAQIQASRNPQNLTQIQQSAVHELNSQLRNMRQDLVSLVQHGDASPAASTAISNALDQLQQTLT